MIPIADVQLRFRAESSGARRDVAQLKQEIQELRQGMVQTQRTATEATQVVNRLGNEAKAAAIGVTSLESESECRYASGESGIRGVALGTGTL